MREIGKEPQLAGLKRCRETFDKKRRRFSVTGAINKAICGTKADPVPQ